MSIRVSSLVWDYAPVSGSDLIVLLVIADHASDDGTNAWPSVATMARKARISPRTVQRCIAKLEDAGLIEVAQQRGGDANCPPDRRPNLYRVRVHNFANGVTSASPRTPTGVTPVTERGDTRVANGVTPVSPKPSLNRPEPFARAAELSTTTTDLPGVRDYVTVGR